VSNGDATVQGLVFLAKESVLYEDFGQKCEFMDRKGQIFRLLFCLNSTLSRVGRLKIFPG
jgi:hypothetical protein